MKLSKIAIILLTCTLQANYAADGQQYRLVRIEDSLGDENDMREIIQKNSAEIIGRKLARRCKINNGESNLQPYEIKYTSNCLADFERVCTAEEAHNDILIDVTSRGHINKRNARKKSAINATFFSLGLGATTAALAYYRKQQQNYPHRERNPNIGVLAFLTGPLALGSGVSAAKKWHHARSSTIEKECQNYAQHLVAVRRHLTRVQGLVNSLNANNNAVGARALEPDGGPANPHQHLLDSLTALHATQMQEMQKHCLQQMQILMQHNSQQKRSIAAVLDKHSGRLNEDSDEQAEPQLSITPLTVSVGGSQNGDDDDSNAGSENSTPTNSGNPPNSPVLGSMLLSGSTVLVDHPDTKPDPFSPVLGKRSHESSPTLPPAATSSSSSSSTSANASVRVDF